MYIHVYLQAFLLLLHFQYYNYMLICKCLVISPLAWQVLWTWEALAIPPNRGMLAAVAWSFLDLRTSFRSCCGGLFGDVTGVPAGSRLFGRGQSLK